MSERARPLVNAAFLCERILTEKDNVQSFVRVVDTFTLTVPVGTTQFPVQTWLAVILKSGAAKGKYTLRFRLHAPSGKTTSLGDDEIPFALEGGERGVQIGTLLTLLLDEQGIFGIDVLVDGEALTRVPFRVRLEHANSTPDEPGQSPR